LEIELSQSFLVCALCCRRSGPPDACVQHPEALPGHDAALADIDGSPTTRRQGQQGGRLQEPSAMITRRHGFSRLIGQVWEPP